MPGLARHSEMELECPFCKKAKVRVYHKEGYLQAKTSRISAGAKQTFHRVHDMYIVRDDCPNCKKTKDEIEKAFEKGTTKQISHEDRLKRLREAGLPTRIEG